MKKYQVYSLVFLTVFTLASLHAADDADSTQGLSHDPEDHAMKEYHNAIDKRDFPEALGIRTALAQQKQLNFELLKVAMQSDIKKIKRSLAAGADPNYRTKSGYTVLMLSIGYRADNPDIVDALVAGGANVNAEKNGFTALTLAAGQENTDKSAKRLVDLGATLNVQTGYGQTPLMKGAKSLFPDKRNFVRTLLQAGADPDIKDHKGKTAYDWAREAHSPCAQILEEWQQIGH